MGNARVHGKDSEDEPSDNSCKEIRDVAAVAKFYGELFRQVADGALMAPVGSPFWTDTTKQI